MGVVGSAQHQINEDAKPLFWTKTRKYYLLPKPDGKIRFVVTDKHRSPMEESVVLLIEPGGEEILIVTKKKGCSVDVYSLRKLKTHVLVRCPDRTLFLKVSQTSLNVL